MFKKICYLKYSIYRYNYNVKQTSLPRSYCFSCIRKKKKKMNLHDGIYKSNKSKNETYKKAYKTRNHPV